MTFDKLKVFNFSSILVLCFLVLSSIQYGQCQDMADYSEVNNSAVLPLITQLVYNRVSNLTNVLGQEINNRSSFCIEDPSEDWNRAFNFSSNLDFLSACIQRTNGDVTRRLCTVAELKFYFNYLFEAPLSSNYMKPNRNCNLTTWISGCEPGWACSIGANQQVDLREATKMPVRTESCDTCCEGFFCPYGLTCMIPCPLGSYCPLAKLNETTGICEPYTYQLPPGQPNHSCGGANIWADVGQSREMFCSSGSYCPTTVQEVPCDSGRYCRMGSTSEKPCYKLVSCDANSSRQNLQTYGIMLIAALITMLLIIYNCSDHFLAVRARRLAKSREAAARSARETAKARQRWKAAKDAAKRHALEISGTFSRKRSPKNSEQLRILNQETPSVDNSSLPPVHWTSPAPSGQSKEKKKEPAAKEMHTRSQIFKYAYAQLEKEKEKEKEKALENDEKNITFSGVISMATNPEVKKRPLIEISFKELTLTLKGKNKHLLRCVNGTLKPGRITAVMGPSGAGKTSFLSALAGKAVGCSMTGLILINGKKESIHSYKKIMGFVPQDDIVHGNLTVEENLWFSAKCRLAAKMSKAEKVLVIERVIESLGLQSVRDSLVGTIEKRGISGGQRKRVNVGLEMVMEPSLFILDEPTSGLDSASSQLLMRALRHESLEGVNICMVVHQPSYALFQMFNDLILLAKGGLIVYHGPVQKVEEYFSGLGINVPERVNPPDHFMDFLEGIVNPSTSTGVTHKELPIRWMIYNGYPVPPDMRAEAGSVLSNGRVEVAVGINAINIGSAEQSFAGELWQDVRSNVERQRDKLRLNFLKSKDLANRSTPSVFAQYRYFLGRVGKQRLRDAKVQAVDFLILLLAGACLGILAKGNDESFGAAGYTYTIIAVSLLCKIAALRSFSLDKLQHWRESASGMSTLAYFLARDTIDHFNTVIKPVVYLAMFYFFTNPRSSFQDNYIVLLCLVYCVTGMGYALAIFFEAGAAQLWSVLLPVIMTLVATRRNTGIMKVISDVCYPKWALEAFVIANAKRYYGVWLITRCGALLGRGYDIRDFNTCIVILIFTGVISRIIAYLGMLIFQKK
ncbi:hypothetical protein CDL15_Pgr026060 [Punica granatum]|uniref:ABC transporter domain-containing protein n=1 Tax=Punica granatum TaxID=22663 RepID=A0A218WCZ6_PUNGR|nr:hypothetical protein CDL15_Pgr026060 [Punica granatum]PKI46733.1 hypothetical protein CRG98_032873 [Punica granatum]